MHISFTQLDTLLIDTATHFATIPERNNVDLIRRMVNNGRVEIPSTFCTDLTFTYTGTRTTLPNSDWAAAVDWQCMKNELTDQFRAIGEQIGDQYVYHVEYNRHLNFDSDNGWGTIKFDAAGRTISDETRMSRDNVLEFLPIQILAFVAPRAVLLQHLTQSS